MHPLLKIEGCSCTLCTRYYEGPVMNQKMLTGKLTGIKTSISNVAKMNLSTKCINICKKIHKTARLTFMTKAEQFLTFSNLVLFTRPFDVIYPTQTEILLECQEHSFSQPSAARPARPTHVFNRSKIDQNSRYQLQVMN